MLLTRKKESTFNRLSKTKEDGYCIAKAARIAPSDVEFPYNKAVASHLSTVKDCLSASLYDKADI